VITSKYLEDYFSKNTTHAPSVPKLNSLSDRCNIVDYDACFLTNPYMVDLVRGWFKDVELRDMIKDYPSLGSDLSRYIGDFIGVNEQNVFVGNGASEIIQIICNNILTESVVIPIPTYSDYYTFGSYKNVFYCLDKTDSFNICVDKLIDSVIKSNAKNLVLVNPNNPTGSVISKNDMTKILTILDYLDCIVVDESFIGFSEVESVEDMTDKFKNLIVVKSLSKQYGLSGCRIGYVVSNHSVIKKIAKCSQSWNINAFAEYVIRNILDKKNFLHFKIAEEKYRASINILAQELSKIEGIKVYDSKANFFLVELSDNINSINFASVMLHSYGVYVRYLKSKLGLDGSFIRVAASYESDGYEISRAIKYTLKDMKG